jgi:hypothetical protein
VVATVGGGIVTERFADDEAFAWYAIGLLAGMAIFLLLRLILKDTTSVILGDD